MRVESTATPDIEEPAPSAGEPVRAAMGCPGRTRDPIVALAGGASAALGIAVLLGWQFNIPPLIQIFPDFTAMAYNTAVGFVAFGFALMALSMDRRAPARLAAGVGGLIALLRLFQYVTGAPKEFETLLSRFALPHPPIAGTEMAPNTAIAFVLTAAAVWLCSRRHEFRGKAMAVAFCGSGGAALGLNAFTGYLTGLQTYIWGQFKPMAAHTSVGLIILGAALVVVSWRQGRGVERDRRAWALVIVVMGGLVTSLSFWQALSIVEQLRAESVIRLRSGMPETVLVFGVLMTTLLATAVYLAQTARLRTALAERLRLDAERSSEELKRASAYNRSLIEASLDPLVTIAPDGTITDVNRATEEATGYSRQELIGTDFADYFTEARKARDGYQKTFRDGRVQDYELAIQRRDGHLTPVLYNASLYRDQSGAVAGVFAAARDVTERRNAELQLARANAYNRSLIESSLDPLVTIAADGEITDVNRATEDVTGCPRQQLIGTDFSNYFTDPERARRGYEKAFREGAVQDYELEIRRGDGRLTPVLYNAAVYRDETQAVAGVFAAARDITGRKRAEEELAQKARDLERSNADLEQFAYVASHDLQEPLRMVANFTQLLADRYRDKLGQDGVEFIGYAVDGAKRMQRLIQDLLSYSRVGTRAKDFESTDANERLGEAVANLQAAIEESGAVVTHEELPAVTADPAQLAQVFQNLLSNAIKFHGAGAPRVHISARREAAQWVFAVQDNGIGIAPEFAQRIFVIFQRLHSRGEYPGTGIGLALCKKIVERHGGRIWVESEPGHGAIFFFTIPTRRAKAT